MPDWTKTMIQTFEYYIVDPETWKDVKKLNCVTKSNISRDSEAETLGSANIDVTEGLNECYVRIYMVTSQNGITERFPFGTFLIQTPTTNFDGQSKSVSVDAYTPLLELKENPPPIGYTILKGENVMSYAYRLARDNTRTPVVEAIDAEILHSDFTANTDDTWLSFISDLAARAKNHIELDEIGRILFAPNQEIDSLQPVWTYSDDNSSILYPNISIDQDLYSIPNVVEVSYSEGVEHYYAIVKNDDPNSPTSTVNRGRVITHRVTNPDFSGDPSDIQIKEYANNLLKELSTVKCTLSYTHGYCPVRLGDCVRLNYKRAGLIDVKAKVTNQSIECATGCKVTETAVYSTKLWG